MRTKNKVVICCVLAILGMIILILPSNCVAEEIMANSWTDMNPSTKPSARSGHAMAYDSESDRSILFGGYSGSYEGDTWAYDYNTNTWTLVKASGPGTPPIRSQHTMAYDTESDRVILFGGQYEGTPLGDTWAYDYNINTWTIMNPLTAPSPTTNHAMVYDSESDRVIIFGGPSAETWVYNYNSNIWTKKTPASSPNPRSDHAMAYDSESDRVIMFGRDGGGSFDTWAYDYNMDAWTNLNPMTGPSSRSQHAMAYDSESDRVVLFGGSGLTDDTWTYDFNANIWVNKNPSAKPSPRIDFAMSYDSESDRIILFGGLATLKNDETWSYELSPPDVPFIPSLFIVVPSMVLMAFISFHIMRPSILRLRHSPCMRTPPPNDAPVHHQSLPLNKSGSEHAQEHPILFNVWVQSVEFW